MSEFFALRKASKIMFKLKKIVDEGERPKFPEQKFEAIRELEQIVGDANIIKEKLKQK